jgi:hypothetical protein
MENRVPLIPGRNVKAVTLKTGKNKEAAMNTCFLSLSLLEDNYTLGVVFIENKQQSYKLLPIVDEEKFAIFSSASAPPPVPKDPVSEIFFLKVLILPHLP